MSDMKTILNKVADGKSLSVEESEQAFDLLMSGEATPGQIGGFLMALRVRGETVDEITGGVKVMRSKALPVSAPDDAMDIVGTGGDGVGTLNISTATAFVVAGCGIPIAKHGNKALSSKSGAADVLAHLGVKLDIAPDHITKCIHEAGIGFMMAPFHHSAMKHVGPVRVEMGIRTIFNLMGPLSNPASAKHQLIGVYAREWLEPMTKVLQSLGSENVWLVHGSDGLDEITITGPTHVVALKDGTITSFDISPEDAGLPTAPLSEILGGDPAHNAQRLRALLDGQKDAYRDTVVLNSSAALVAAGKASDLKDGVALAEASIDNGHALASLNKLVEISNT